MNLQWHTIKTLERDAAAMPSALVETAAWIRHTIAQPHPQLGRPGPICSKVPAALVHDSIWLGIVQMAQVTAEDVTAAMATLTEAFFSLSPHEFPGALFKGVMVLFDTAAPQETVALIEQVQRAHKMALIEAGLLLGKFHRDSRNTAMHNKNFNPSQSPYPMLGVRPILENDLKFMLAQQEQDKLSHIRRFLQSERNYLPAHYINQINA